jgi:hypothetical protein
MASPIAGGLWEVEIHASPSHLLCKMVLFFLTSPKSDAQKSGFSNSKVL